MNTQPTYDASSWYIRLAFGLRPEKPKRANWWSITLGCIDSISYYAVLNFFSVVLGIGMILVWGSILPTVVCLIGWALLLLIARNPLETFYVCIGAFFVATLVVGYIRALSEKGTSLGKELYRWKAQIHRYKERICPTRDIV